MSLRGDFSKREHYDAIKDRLTIIVKRLEGSSRLTNYCTILHIMKQLIRGLEDFQEHTPVQLGLVRLQLVRHQVTNQPHKGGPHITLGIETIADQARALVDLVGRSIELRPRKRRKLRRDFSTLHETIYQELCSRHRLTLDASKQRLANLQSRLCASASAKVRRAKEQHRVQEGYLHRIADEWWLRTGERIKGAWSDAAPTIEFSPTLTRDDRALADMWKDPNHWDTESEERRCYAARLAEKSALQFYGQFDCVVEDVSIAQPTGTTRGSPVADVGGAWTKCDLLVDGSPIDVKNVRGRGAFGGYVLKGPKRYRNEEVRICGVVTDFSDDRGRYDTQRRSNHRGDNRSRTGAARQMILGETSNGQLTAVADRAKELAGELGLRLDVGRMVRWQRGLGAWHLDFDGHHYIDSTTSQLGALVHGAQLRQHLGDVPDWAIGLSASRCGPAMVNGCDTGRAAELMRDWLGKGVISRPLLFVFALLYLLAAARDECYVTGEAKEELLQLFFIDRGEVGLQHPLGLYDPIRVVHAIIDTIDRLARLNQGALRNVSEFQLKGLGILRARRESNRDTDQTRRRARRGRWYTLLAYCGGCGKSPIWAGDISKLWKEGDPRDKGTRRPSIDREDGCGLCHQCLHLICDICGYCDKNCPNSGRV